MATAVVRDKFDFENGDTAVFLDMKEGNFSSKDTVSITRSGEIVGETIIFPKDGNTLHAEAKGKKPQALIKGVRCAVGDIIVTAGSPPLRA